MKNRAPLVQTADVFLQASNIMISTLPLQRQIQACYVELTAFLKLEAITQADKARISDLKDEIWGCRIEVQSLYLQAKRLLKTARYIGFGDLEQPVEFAPYC